MTKHTALHAEHEQLGASFTDFGGWDMPLKYGSELAEHRAVRESAGLFDLSHMGEVWVSGDDAAVFLNSALVGNLAIMAIGKAKYSLICTPAGGIIDDLIVYRVADTRFLVVPNAGNADVVAAALAERSAGFAVDVIDSSADTSLIAVQGPASEAIVCAAVAYEAQREAVRELGYYAWIPIRISGIDIVLARTGYTGEDGFELFLPNEHAATIWQLMLETGAQHDILPCGLASRDSLRLEAGMPLYGNELGLETTPYDAGLGGVVSFKKTEDFIGRSALEAAKQAGAPRVLVGLVGTGRRAARAGYAVHATHDDGTQGEEIGQVTSGLLSPTLGHPIALARIDASFAEIGTEVAVDLRGKPATYEVVALPFYHRQA